MHQKLHSALMLVSILLTASNSHQLCFAADPDSDQAPSTWGTVIDPSGDCQITTSNGTLTVAVPGSDHALCIEMGRTNAPRILREVSGDFAAQIKISAKFATAPASLVTGRRPYQSAGLLVWQDSGTYVRFELAHMMVGDQTMDFASLELRRDGLFEIPGYAETHPLQGSEVFLRIERHGDQITASESSNGAEWKPVGSLTLSLPKGIQVGVSVGNNTSSAVTVEFSDFLVSPVENSNQSAKPK